MPVWLTVLLGAIEGFLKKFFPRRAERKADANSGAEDQRQEQERVDNEALADAQQTSDEVDGMSDDDVRDELARRVRKP